MSPVSGPKLASMAPSGPQQHRDLRPWISVADMRSFADPVGIEYSQRALSNSWFPRIEATASLWSGTDVPS